MDVLTPAQIEQYIASGDWKGKAGGYGIQDRDPFVSRISGSHTNVVGLPMEAVGQILSRTGIQATKKQG
jgi:septum formation protein